jgi:hypothetical protein
MYDYQFSPLLILEILLLTSSPWASPKRHCMNPFQSSPPSGGGQACGGQSQRLSRGIFLVMTYHSASHKAPLAGLSFSQTSGSGRASGPGSGSGSGSNWRSRPWHGSNFGYSFGLGSFRWLRLTGGLGLGMGLTSGIGLGLVHFGGWV